MARHHLPGVSTLPKLSIEAKAQSSKSSNPVLCCLAIVALTAHKGLWSLDGALVLQRSCCDGMEQQISKQLAVKRMAQQEVEEQALRQKDQVESHSESILCLRLGAALT